jgi:hypothetical protein
MKKLIIIILMVLLVTTSHVFAEDKESRDLPKYNTLMLLKGNLPLVDKYDYVFINEKMTKGNEMSDCLGCIEEKKRFGRMGIGGEITNLLNKYENEKINTPTFSLIIIPNIEESQPSGIIKFTYSY